MQYRCILLFLITLISVICPKTVAEQQKKQETPAAITILLRTAQQGNAESQAKLAQAYLEGRGVQQSDLEAAKWYRKAAEQGNADAQSNLGVMYAQGKGVTQDYIQAHLWLNLSAAGLKGEEWEKAAKARDAVASKMTAQQLAEAQRLAREWQSKRAK